MSIKIIHQSEPSTVDFSFLTNLMFGPGSDGDVTISSNTTLTRPMFYRNLTISSGILRAFSLQSFIFVKGTLTIAADAEIKDYYSYHGGNGGNGTAIGGGTGGVATYGYAGNGGNAGIAGSNSVDNYNMFSGGNIFETGHPLGGIGGGGGGSIMGVPAGELGYQQIMADLPFIRNPLFSMIQWRFNQEGKSYGMLNVPGLGGTGGGGGEDGVPGNYGGGGGAGGEPGGLLWVFAKNIILSGSINVNGGNGGNGGNAYGAAWGGGGGGGGSGGYLCVVCQTIDHPENVTATRGLGGTRGAGNGTGGTIPYNGNPGEDGVVDLYTGD